MPLYEIKHDCIEALDPTTFALLGLRERQDLQRLLLDHADLVCPGVLPLCEEFGHWEDSKRRIDILGLDRDANLVVIELKRTDSGGHVDLQAIRYAAMVSQMTFEQAVEAYQRWLNSTGRDGDARQAILEHLQWEEADEEAFGRDVRIVLVSADFSKEVTTTALWLCERGVDVSCVRLRPYSVDARHILDVQRLIPLPEAGEYMEKIRKKEQEVRRRKSEGRDYTKFDVRLGSELFQRLSKRRAIFLVTRHLCQGGATPEDVARVVSWKSNLWYELPGTLGADGFANAAAAHEANGGPVFRANRWYVGDDELVHACGKTYALSSQWGRHTEKAMRLLIERWPDAGVHFRTSEEQ